MLIKRTLLFTVPLLALGAAAFAGAALQAQAAGRVVLDSAFLAGYKWV